VASIKKCSTFLAFCFFTSFFSGGLQIETIRMADIPYVDLSALGTSTFGSFSVEVVDPVADYLELLQVRLPFSDPFLVGLLQVEPQGAHWMRTGSILYCTVLHTLGGAVPYHNVLSCTVLCRKCSTLSLSRSS